MIQSRVVKLVIAAESTIGAVLEVHESEIVLPTHAVVPAGPIPTALDPNGIYPYESYCETSRRPVLRKYRLIHLENERLRVSVCPDLGGRVYSLFLKSAQVETLFASRVIRPVRILPRQAFIGGGIEVSFPVSHTPVLLSKVLHRTGLHGDRLYLWCGERELRFGMHWTVEYSIGEHDAFLTQRTVFYNPDQIAHPWMSWSNAGVPARPDTEFHFPGGTVLAHGRELTAIDWQRQGPRRQSDVARMTGYFWQRAEVCAFGAYTPSLRSGLYHVADPTVMPGIKLWTDGVGPQQEWVSQYTVDRDQCLEIQAGPLLDQSIKARLEPQQRHEQVELWIPADRALDITALRPPVPRLLDVEKVPRFGWARDEEVALWVEVLHAAGSRQVRDLPAPPDVDDNRWAVSGMADLGDALQWAARVTEGAARDRWLLQLGAWQAARDEVDAALESLAGSGDDRARALAGRIILRTRSDASGAVAQYRMIRSEALALHPQVAFERDVALAALGNQSLEERARWLDAVSALEDEWLVERRASLLIDQGRSEDARRLLQETRFQLVHQRYERTRLWRRIEAQLGLDPIQWPSWLGEDDLAEFGAYREYSR